MQPDGLFLFDNYITFHRKGEKKMIIAETKLDELESKFIEDAWSDETCDAESVEAYLSDFVTAIKEEAEEE